jgi:hypothetical protein
LNGNNFNPRICYPAKLLFKIDGTIRVFHDKQELKQYMTTKPPLQRFPKKFCIQIMKENNTMKGQVIPNQRRRKGKKLKSNIYSATHNQILNQQRQLHYRDHHVLINTNTEY